MHTYRKIFEFSSDKIPYIFETLFDTLWLLEMDVHLFKIDAHSKRYMYVLCQSDGRSVGSVAAFNIQPKIATMSNKTNKKH